MGTSWDNDRSVRTPQNGPFRLRSSSLTGLAIKARIGAVGFAALTTTPGAPGDFVKIIELVKCVHARHTTAPLALLSVAPLAPKSLPLRPAGDQHAAEPPTARRAARHLARARRGEIRRGFLLREVRRYPCAGDGDARGPATPLAQGPGARLGHGGIRHAAARHLRAHAARGIGRQAERTHHRDPAADRA